MKAPRLNHLGVLFGGTQQSVAVPHADTADLLLSPATFISIMRLSVAPANKLYTINATRADWTVPLTRNPPPKIDTHCEAVGIKSRRQLFEVSV